jgi:hypothetical protein
MVASHYDHLREQERPVDQEDVRQLRQAITVLSSIVAELADHAYWHETYGNDNAENKTHLRSLKEQAQRITVGRAS